MPLDATDFGYVSILRDEPVPGSQTSEKVGGYCVIGTATSAMTPGGIVIADSAADLSFTTTTSANSTAKGGYVVAGLGTVMGAGMQWDFVTAIATGQKILVLIKGIVYGYASAAILRGARVGTSTTAGQVVTTTTQDASNGVAMSAATIQGDRIYILV